MAGASVRSVEQASPRKGQPLALFDDQQGLGEVDQSALANLTLEVVHEMIRHRSDINHELFGVRQACSISGRERWR